MKYSPRIGDWVSRRLPGARWHYVDSLVAGDVITKCGKRMADSPKPRLEFAVYPADSVPAQPASGACRTCSASMAKESQ